MTDDTLRDLGKQLPVDRPDASRTAKVRASLLAAAAVPTAPPSRRWLLVGGGFAEAVAPDLRRRVVLEAEDGDARLALRVRRRRHTPAGGPVGGAGRGPLVGPRRGAGAARARQCRR